jgi:hypothetical protein
MKDTDMAVINNQDKTTLLPEKEYNEILQYVEGYDSHNSDDDDDEEEVKKSKNKKKKKKKEHTKVEHDAGTESKVSSHKVDGTNLDEQKSTPNRSDGIKTKLSSSAGMVATESSTKNGHAATNTDVSTPIPSPPELQRINQASLIRTTTPGAVSVVPASQYRCSNDDERTATTDNIRDDSVGADGDDDDVEQQQSQSEYVNEEPIVATLVETKQDLPTSHDGEEDHQEPEQALVVAKAVVLPESKSSWKFRALLCCVVFLLLALLVAVLTVTLIDADDGDVVDEQLAPIQADFVSVSNETTTNTSASYDYDDVYGAVDDDDDQLAPSRAEFWHVSNETTAYPTALDNDHDDYEVDDDN